MSNFFNLSLLMLSKLLLYIFRVFSKIIYHDGKTHISIAVFVALRGFFGFLAK